MLIFMKMNMLSALVLALTLSTTAVAGSLPVVSVKPHAVDLTFPSEAVVEAIQQATVGAQVPGRVLEVKADAGQLVKKGDVLMRIDAREAAEAARAAEAQFANAKVNYERTKSLVAQKFMSAAAQDKARADFDAASANRAAAGASQSHATIVAPIAGIVARRHAELGDMAMPGTPLFTIYQPGGLRVTASIPQYRLKDMRGVKTAKVEFPESGKWVEATAVQVLPTADAATHVSQVRVTLPTVPEATPGMFARVHFVHRAGRKADRAGGRRGSPRRSRGGVHRAAGRSADSVCVSCALAKSSGRARWKCWPGLPTGDQVVTDPVRAAIQLTAGK